MVVEREDLACNLLSTRGSDWPRFKIKGLTNVNPFKFVQEVRQEVAKVTWPTRNETWVTTIAVLIMITLASIFFMLADQAMGWLVSIILGIGR